MDDLTIYLRAYLLPILMLFVFSGCGILERDKNNNDCPVNSNKTELGSIKGDIIFPRRFSSPITQIHISNIQTDSTSFIESDLPLLSNPQISPDSSQILALVYPGFTDVGFELYLMDIDGGNVRPANSEEPVFAFNPSWSPDGKYIAYEFCNFCPAGRNSNIYVYSVETGQVTKLTNREFDDAFPFWLPNSEMVLFQSSRDSTDYSLNLFSVDIFSKEIKQLTQLNSPKEAVFPSVNPITGEIIYSLRTSNTHDLGSTYQTVLYKGLTTYELIDFDTEGYTQVHWSQNGELALIYGEDSALNEAVMKMYSFSDGCFELEGIETESSNQIIKKLTEFPIFQWYLR